MFSEGREDVNDEERAGRPSTSTTDEKINEVEKMLLANRRITVREVAEDLNISIGSCHSIFINDLGMRRVAAKFVPKLLNCDQKHHRMNIANDMLDSARDDPNLLQRVITGDEAGVVHHELLPQDRTVNKEYYLQVMRNLREAIRQKRPDLWKNKNWLLHYDNAPAHTSLLVRDLLAKNNTLMMPQPPYSPDLAPCDFFLFPKLKRPMKGRRYATLDEIKTASKEELKKILKNDFLKCFEDWKNRWHKCIISHGDYFEGDKIGKNNVRHLLTSAHHPETNAKVERLNSTIINRLRCEYNHNLKIPWTKYIPNITESYNDTVHTITGFTPRFLYYGIQPQYIEHDTETPIEKARKLTIERTIKSHEHSKQLYDIKHPEPIFKEGDQVLVKTFIYPNTGKLTQRYIGPFKILKQLSPVTYEINKPILPQRKQTEIIHSNKLKLFYPESDFLLQNSTNLENDLIVNQISNTKLIDIDDKPCFLQKGHILDMDNGEQISTPILLPTHIT
ncbi:hypothetical protein LAZ67_11002233 [Cordylochernes scorpioides]|uniref:Integrase catalytic domain-containing protein n=1 Tax=Cordylochernes scorpioides TaxID=51811 RepID=A0ABY6KZ28_9ARAC|nr:hypothetical protein LAZ67_11002233 [Cordylochernes scorpioides]